MANLSEISEDEFKEIFTFNVDLNKFRERQGIHVEKWNNGLLGVTINFLSHTQCCFEVFYNDKSGKHLTIKEVKIESQNDGDFNYYFYIDLDVSNGPSKFVCDMNYHNFSKGMKFDVKLKINKANLNIMSGSGFCRGQFI